MKLRLLLLLGLLLLQVGVVTRWLRLEPLLLLLLTVGVRPKETRLLHAVTVGVAGVPSLLRLESGVGVRHVARRLTLHLVSIDGIREEVDGVALLVPLVAEARELVLVLGRRVGIDQVAVVEYRRPLEFLAARFLLLLA